MVEQLTLNQRVAGSSPARFTNPKPPIYAGFLLFWHPGRKSSLFPRVRQVSDKRQKSVLYDPGIRLNATRVLRRQENERFFLKMIQTGFILLSAPEFWN